MAKKKYNQVFQFKITLEGIKPPIWRRIQVPEIYTFWDLHVAIQDAMDWDDCHFHEFEMVNPSTGLRENIGIPAPDEVFGREVLPGWEEKIADFFSMANRTASYVYDFGDGWEHKIELEKIIPRDKDIRLVAILNPMKCCLLRRPLLRAYCSFLRISVLRAFPNYSATSLLNIRYVSKAKEHVLPKIVAVSGGIQSF